jgi:hypothetical protein
VEHDAFNIGAIERKETLYTHAIADFTHGKRGGSSVALALNNIALKALDTLFVAFNNLIVNGDVVTGFELRMLPYRGKLFVYKTESLLVHG